MKIFTHRAARLFAPALLLLLTACGGGGGSSDEPSFLPDDGTGTGGGGAAAGGGGTGGTGTGGTAGSDIVVIGSVMDGTFVEGQVNVGVDTLSAGGMTELTVNLVDGNGNPVSDPTNISFTSDCAADGTAMLNTTATTVNGQASVEYIAQGCVGADQIRASTDVGGTTILAVGTITVEQDAIGSIEFVSADPAQIALSGTGGDETSRVTFRVLGASGGPVEGANVSFDLNASTGGLELLPTSAVSTGDGLVSTVIGAGSIATSVRVTATEQTTNISTQSSELVVSTGIPDSDSFSLTRTVSNVEGFDFDNEESIINIRAADAFNNPVPDGTAISFFAEGGAVDPSCTTVNGGCSVTWRSQNPRPADGVVTILATAIGNESFDDQDGDGRFDDNATISENFTDLPEAFADEDLHYDPAVNATRPGAGIFQPGEFFIDFGPGGSPNGAYDGPDGAYNGVLCANPAEAGCSPDNSVTVFDSVLIVMSGSGANIFVQDGVDLAGDPIFIDDDLDVALAPNVLSVIVADDRGNALPIGTTVEISVTAGYTLDGDTSVEVPDTLGPTSSGIILSQTAGSVQTGGILSIEVTTPNAVRSTRSIVLQDI